MRPKVRQITGSWSGTWSAYSPAHATTPPKELCAKLTAAIDQKGDVWQAVFEGIALIHSLEGRVAVVEVPVCDRDEIVSRPGTSGRRSPIHSSYPEQSSLRPRARPRVASRAFSSRDRSSGFGVRVRELQGKRGTTAVLTSARCVASGTQARSTGTHGRSRNCGRVDKEADTKPAQRRRSMRQQADARRSTRRLLPARHSAGWKKQSGSRGHVPDRRFTSATVTETASSASG